MANCQSEYTEAGKFCRGLFPKFIDFLIYSILFGALLLAYDRVSDKGWRLGHKINYNFLSLSDAPKNIVVEFTIFLLLIHYV